MNMNPLIASLVLLTSLSGQPGNTPPTAKLQLPTKVAPGSAVKGTVKVTIAQGLHAYQNPPSEAYMIPLVLEGATKGLTLKVTYPKGVAEKVAGEDKPVPVYAGEIQIPFEFKAPAKTGAFKFDLKLKYQQCNNSGCFPPGEIMVSGTVNVKK